MIRAELLEEGDGKFEWLRWPLGHPVSIAHVISPQVFNRDLSATGNLVWEITGAAELKILRQVHSAFVFCESEVGEPFSVEGDGIFGSARVPLAILTADCLPLILTDGHGVALLHVGWRGMVQGIVERGLLFFGNHREVRAFLGPCIRECCYQVDTPFLNEVAGVYPKLTDSKAVVSGGGEVRFSIPVAVGHILKNLDVRAVYDSGLCTCCDNRFPSYRRDGEAAGRMLTLVWKE